MPLDVSTGTALGAVRRAHGITQRELAARAGMTAGYLSQLEARAHIPVRTQLHLSTALAQAAAATSMHPRGAEPSREEQIRAAFYDVVRALGALRPLLFPNEK